MGGNMRLRNKKTGEIGRLYFDHQLIDPKTGTYAIVIQHRDKLGYEAFANYFTLAELNEEWEDYKPKEPYIGDEATAKFVRAWAKHWGIEKVMARIRFDHGVDLVGWVEDSGGREIDIQGAFVSGEIKDCHEYTIAELCGEETPEPLEPSFIDLDERIKEKAAAGKLYKGENDMHLTEEEE